MVVGTAAMESLQVTLREAQRRLVILNRREMALYEGRVFTTISMEDGETVQLGEVAVRRLEEIQKERTALEQRIEQLEAQARGRSHHLAY